MGLRTDERLETGKVGGGKNGFRIHGLVFVGLWFLSLEPAETGIQKRNGHLHQDKRKVFFLCGGAHGSELWRQHGVFGARPRK